MKKRRTLKFKLGILMAVTSLFFGVLAMAVTYYLVNQSLVSQEIDNLKIVSQEISKEINNEFNLRLDVASNFSKREKIVTYMAQEDRGLQDVEILKALKDANIEDQYSAIYILDKEGTTLVSTDESFVGNNYGFRDYIKESLADESGLDVVVGATSGKLGFYFSQPIKDDEENILGVFAMKLKPEVVYELFDESAFLQTEEEHVSLYFLEKNGVIVYSNIEERIYSGFNYLDQNTLNNIEEERRFPQVSAESYVFDLLPSRWQLVGRGDVFEIVDLIDQENELVAVMPMKSFAKFWVASTISADVIYQRSWQISIAIGGFVLLAAILAVLFVYILIGRQLKPLNKLRELANKVAKGNLEQSLNIKTNDEIEDLADSFNAMIKSVRKSRDQIEERVNKRTGELEKLNRAMTGRELKMIELKKEIKELKDKK